MFPDFNRPIVPSSHLGSPGAAPKLPPFGAMTRLRSPGCYQQGPSFRPKTRKIPWKIRAPREGCRWNGNPGSLWLSVSIIWRTLGNMWELPPQSGSYFWWPFWIEFSKWWQIICCRTKRHGCHATCRIELVGIQIRHPPKLATQGQGWC